MEIGVTKAVQDKIKSKLAVITKDVAFTFSIYPMYLANERNDGSAVSLRTKILTRPIGKFYRCASAVAEGEHTTGIRIQMEF